MRRPTVDWDAQPLGKKTDVEIAEGLGMSPGAVRNARVARGIPALKRTSWNHRPARPGDRYGHWVLRRFLGMDKYGQRWLVESDCGATKRASLAQIRHRAKGPSGCRAAMDRLPPRYRRFLEMRYGFSGKPLPLSRIAASEGISRPQPPLSAHGPGVAR